jgi:hypothetical protein
MDNIKEHIPSFEIFVESIDSTSHFAHKIEQRLLDGLDILDIGSNILSSYPKDRLKAYVSKMLMKEINHFVENESLPNIKGRGYIVRFGRITLITGTSKIYPVLSTSGFSGGGIKTGDEFYAIVKEGKLITIMLTSHRVPDKHLIDGRISSDRINKNPFTKYEVITVHDMIQVDLDNPLMKVMEMPKEGGSPEFDRDTRFTGRVVGTHK